MCISCTHQNRTKWIGIKLIFVSEKNRPLLLAKGVLSGFQSSQGKSIEKDSNKGHANIWNDRYAPDQFVRRTSEYFPYFTLRVLQSCFADTGTIKQLPYHAPVPLSIFRSNSKFDENSERSSFEYTRPITTIFCTRHDSVTVVTCAKYRCYRPRIFYTRMFWIFIEFRIRSKYA